MGSTDRGNRIGKSSRVVGCSWLVSQHQIRGTPCGISSIKELDWDVYFHFQLLRIEYICSDHRGCPILGLKWGFSLPWKGRQRALASLK